LPVKKGCRAACRLTVFIGVSLFFSRYFLPSQFSYYTFIITLCYPPPPPLAKGYA
jgi:hypothetical protein